MRNPNITDNTAQLAIGRVSKSAQKAINTVSVEEYRAMQNKPKRSKYGNVKTQRIVGGNILRFDSTREANRFSELLLLLDAEIIVSLKLQPTFTLSEAYTTITGERIAAERYQADFSYSKLRDPDDRTKGYEFVVEDVKGMRTQVYLSKKKRKKNQ